MKVGYIGLGALGSELAKCFLKGHHLIVWDIEPAACAPLEALGATVAPTAAHLGRACDVLLLCLPRSSDVREVLFGTHGLADALGPNKLVVDQTSGVPEQTREMAQRLAQRGIGMMDAAVSASPHVVATGGATLMASGADDVFERVHPVLSAITPTVFRCGNRVGDGQAMKMVNNAMNGGCRLATLELAALGRKAGLSLASITEAFNGGAGRNQTTEKMLPAIARGESSTNFALALMLKDVDQAVELGAGAGLPMPLVRTVRALLQVGLNTIGPAARLEDMVGLLESMAATRLAAPVDPGSEGPAELPGLLDQALWAVCHAISNECMTAGRKYGLSLQSMAAVLPRCSGWSAALLEISSAALQGAAPRQTALGAVATTLRQATRLGSRHAAPVVIANIACSLLDDAVNRFGAHASVDVLARPHTGEQA